jgi:hypothetical protein
LVFEQNMNDSGPTTAGSIIARLKMDRDQWIADMAKTKEDARELGALRPTIRIDVDTAGAMAQIEALRVAAERAGVVSPGVSAVSGPSAGTAAKVDAVAAAERRLAAAVSAADTAYARAELAQMRLNETREKGVNEGARLAAAELAATEAVKRLDAANEKATLSEAALTAAQDKAARAALEKAAAEETAAGSTVKANEANKTSASRMGLITGAVALLLPLLVPVAAGAVGIAGAMTMMGVSGVLAVVGIKREMEQGTETGKAYQDGLVGLRQDMNQLAQTSAVNMLSSFRQVVGDTADAMPLLNRETAEFTGMLGRSGGNLFSGSINGLRVMEPLLLTAGLYVERLTRQFDQWTQNGGLQKFSSYALMVLPNVEQVLGALASAIMHILEALAPLGQIGMAVLTGISDVINAIPVDVLGSLIGAVTWGMIAFKGWGFIAPMLAKVATGIGLVGTATQIATGPIGWIVAGVSALAAVLAVVMFNTKNAADATQNYTSAVQADTGAIGENVKAAAVKALQDAGALDAAKRLGISAALVTQATLGDTAAKKKLNAELAVINKRLREQSDASTGASGPTLKQAQDVDTLTGALKGQNQGIKDSIAAYNVYQEAMGGTTIATKAQRGAVEANAKAAGVSVSAYLGALAAQSDTKGQLDKTTASMFLQGDAAGLLKQSLDLLNGKTLNAAQAQNQFDSQIANMTAKTTAAERALSGNSAAAVKNRGELISLTQAAENNADAFRDNGGSAEDTKQKLIDMKQAIIDNAVAHGENRDEVQKYVDTLYTIPDHIPATKVEIDASEALAQIAKLQAAWTVFANSQAVKISAGQSFNVGVNHDQGHAGGGTIRGLADGGSSGTVYGPGNASSDTAGLFRLANTEEVISNRFGQADRNRVLLKQINAGYTPSSQGNATAQPAPATKTEVHHTWNITTSGDASAAATEVMRRLQMKRA